MNQRSKRGQKKHDDSVRRSVDWHKRHGFSVKADLPGEAKPKTIGGFRPDIIAKKGKKEKVIEVETKATMSRDKKQHQAFRDYANKDKNRTFRKKIVK